MGPRSLAAAGALSPKPYLGWNGRHAVVRMNTRCLQLRESCTVTRNLHNPQFLFAQNGLATAGRPTHFTGTPDHQLLPCQFAATA